jgi:uncharacterized protein DUF5335
MQTREIPRDQWLRTLDEFSKKHQGWIVTVEVFGPTLGDQEEASGLPLVGISADVKDHQSTVEVIVGRGTEAHLTRIINRPKRILFEQPDVPALPGHEAVAVEDDEGTTTLVTFRHVAPDQPARQLPGK